MTSEPISSQGQDLKKFKINFQPSLIDIVIKVSLCALTYMSYKLEPKLLALSFGAGALYQAGYKYWKSGQQDREVEDITHKCKNCKNNIGVGCAGYGNLISGESNPLLINAALAIYLLGIHIEEHADRWVPIIGFFMGARFVSLITN